MAAADGDDSLHHPGVLMEQAPATDVQVRKQGLEEEGKGTWGHGRPSRTRFGIRWEWRKGRRPFFRHVKVPDSGDGARD